jgi:hypothetical protein
MTKPRRWLITVSSAMCLKCSASFIIESGRIPCYALLFFLEYSVFAFHIDRLNALWCWKYSSYLISAWVLVTIVLSILLLAAIRNLAVRGVAFSKLSFFENAPPP